MRLRRSVLLLVVGACAFAGGLLASKALEREARAQSAPFASTIYVPSDGLAFRNFEGRMVARLSYDSHGGTVEVFDEHERLAARMRPDRGATSTPPSGLSNPSKRTLGEPDLGF